MPQAQIKHRMVSGSVCSRAQIHRFAESLRLLFPALLLCFTSATAAQTAESQAGILISDIFVDRVKIFNPEEARRSSVYRVINSLHRTTREQTILRELGIEPGATVNRNDVDEFERILRRMDLFAAVSVELRSLQTKNADDLSMPASGRAETSVAELHIQTRDRLSIVAGASGSFLGGVGELGFTLGERNVSGLGDSFLLSYTGNTENELRGAVSYRDLHFIKKDQRALYQVSRTEEGDSYLMRFQRPFKSRQDNKAWSVAVESVERDIDFYEDGFSVVQIPEVKKSLEFSRVWRHVSAERSLRRGVSLRFNEFVYQQSLGSQADSIVAPDDSNRFYAGFLIAKDVAREYRKVSGMDTLKFTQDLALGSTVELEAGLIISENQSGADNPTAINPRLTARYTNAFAAGENNLLGLSVSGGGTFGTLGSENGEGVGQPWSLSASVRWFNSALDRHTLASRVDYVIADNNDGLPVQYTLGENNGLRGYANKFLSGSERIRINLEDRMDFDWRLGVFDVGALAFFDMGWVADDDGSDELKRSAGVGIRLGSNLLLGAGVIRMDLAVPLDAEAQDDDPTLSVSLGQVFTY